MLVHAILLFALVSLLFYLILGGADYGAGILELFKAPTHRLDQTKAIEKAIGPVWEANHIWLIILVVILFTAFPSVYSTMSVALHIPLVCALLGIVLRGTAFTFRHYDAYRDESQKLYTFVFVTASLITPFWLGVIAGGMILGEIDLDSTDFFEACIRPWLSPFCVSLGFFTCALFAFVASVFLSGEPISRPVRNIFVRRAHFSALVMVLLGLVVFVSAESTGLALFTRFLSQPVCISAVVLASLALALLHVALKRERWGLSRFLAGAVVGLILIGWFGMSYPNVLALKHSNVDFFSVASPPETLRLLLIALVMGFVLVIPALVYLLIVFKASRSAK